MSKLSKINSKFSFREGFTLIELLVVIAIIGILSSVVLASLNSARAKARDARRKSDLNQIRIALSMYYNGYGNYIETGSGCGQLNNGNGWFNFSGDYGYIKSISQCLVDAGFIPQNIQDPSGGIVNSNPTSGFAYMKHTCGIPSKTYIFAKLEGVAQSATATDGTCGPDWDSLYGMNYFITIE